MPHHLRTLRDLIEDNRSGELSRSGLQRREKARAEREAKRKQKKELAERGQREQKQEEQQRAEEQKTDTERAAAAGLVSLEEQKQPQPPPLPQPVPPSFAPHSPPAREEGQSDAEQGSDDDGDADDAAEIGAEGAVAEAHLAVAPQMKIVDGQIVINEESLVLPTPSSVPSPFPLLTESATSRFTSSTFLRHSATAPWTPAETSLFYRALSAYGTDFTLISLMMKGRDRGQVKRKFKKEERENGRLVEEALKRRVRMDVEEFGRRKKEKEEEEEKVKKEREEKEGRPSGDDASSGGGGGGAQQQRERIMVRNRQGKKGPKGKSAPPPPLSTGQVEEQKESEATAQSAAERAPTNEVDQR